MKLYYAGQYIGKTYGRIKNNGRIKNIWKNMNGIRAAVFLHLEYWQENAWYGIIF